MTNNDILRRIRYLFDFSDLKMITLFKLANYDVEKTEVSKWLKKDYPKIAESAKLEKSEIH